VYFEGKQKLWRHVVRTNSSGLVISPELDLSAIQRLQTIFY